MTKKEFIERIDDVEWMFNYDSCSRVDIFLTDEGGNYWGYQSVVYEDEDIVPTFLEDISYREDPVRLLPIIEERITGFKVCNE